MLAVSYDRIGPAREVLRVGELDDPQPGPGELRLRVRASGANPSDTKRRGGWSGPMAFPRIVPHSDGAGVVEAVGDGVDPARVGERVWVHSAQWGRPFGTAAELAVVPAENALPLPEGTSFEAGACLGIPAMTSHFCVLADGPVAGLTVLVTGGAGAVGHYAVQWAHRGGATVIATVSSDAKAEAAREAGADLVLNYREQDVVAEVTRATSGAGVDRVVDVAFGANLATTVPLLRPNGVLASYASDAVPEPTLPFYPLMQKSVNLRLCLVYILPEPAIRRATDEIATALGEGALRHNVARVYPLAETADAHEAIESRTLVGNAVVAID